MIIAMIVTVDNYINFAALAQSNFTTSASSRSTLQATPTAKPPNITQRPAANGTVTAPAVTAPPRPTIIAPSNFTAAAIASETEGGNQTKTSPTNGSTFLGAPE
jgi:hypothetical protein